jgi:hypothetical protein
MRLDEVAGRYPDVQVALDQRRRTIEEAGSRDQRGLRDDLFWRPISGRALTLSAGWVFPDAYEPVDVAQADVFFVTSTILHSMRRAARREGTMLKRSTCAAYRHRRTSSALMTR